MRSGPPYSHLIDSHYLNVSKDVALAYAVAVDLGVRYGYFVSAEESTRMYTRDQFRVHSILQQAVGYSATTLAPTTAIGKEGHERSSPEPKS